MDVPMAGLNGIDATRQIASKAPTSKVIALSAHGDRRSVAEMLTAGAVGYVLKGSCVAELASAIEVVCSGGTYLSPSVADAVVEEYVTLRSRDGGSAWTLLSSRERQVLQMLAEGLNTKMIAYRLGLSARTIERHRSRLMKKLGVDSVAELTKYAMREGLVSLDE
jgi:DNA-binding NarL/FixJ family response regulator